MESSSVANLAKQGQAAAAKASDMVSDLRGEAAPILKKASIRAQAVGQRGISVASDMANQARDAAIDASDSILSYTKKNPAKALAIAAVAGALLFALGKANAMRRD
jgi:ElaB/YqjD/DUF883 family membrane-anchored ribosome-binding protein